MPSQIPSNPPGVPTPAPSGKRHVLLDAWDTWKWYLSFFAALLPIIILSVYSYRVAAESVRNLVSYTNISAATNLSQLINEEMTSNMSTAQTLSRLPTLIAHVKEKDTKSLQTLLETTVHSYDQISHAFIADPNGTLVSQFPEMDVDKVQSPRQDWYWNVSRDWRSYISGVYFLNDNHKSATVAIASPIFDSINKQVLGILVLEINIHQIEQWVESTKLSQDGYLYVLDHTGTVVAHPKMEKLQITDEYRTSLPVMRSILEGNFFLGEYIDPWERRKMTAAFLPITVGKNKWVIVAQQPIDEAYATLQQIRLNISLMGIALTGITFIMLTALVLSNVRNTRLYKELQTKNHQLREAASIVSSSHDAIFGNTLDGLISTWNEAAEQTYGYSAAEAIGKPVSILVPVDRYTEMEAIMEQVKNAQNVQHFDTVRLCKGGKAIEVSLTVSPVKDENGLIIGASSIARDITERKQIEQMRKDVISIVSHQLKAPVSAIRWMVEAILDDVFGKIPKKVRDALTDVQDINLRNSHFLADILNVSRIDRGVIKVDVAPATLKEVVDAALHDYQGSLHNKLVKLVITGKGSIEVMTDKEKFAEALGNAISNAIKHTQKGSITIHMYADEKYGYIDITDTGDGMNEETIRKLFTRDKIISDSATAERSTGLGLYIAKGFMNLQEGDITVVSTLGKGSTFTYKIPLISKKA